MKIIPLSEGRFTIDHTKQFVPFELGSDNLQHRSRGSLLVEVQPFVVITRDEIILLDTGLGFTRDDGSLQIHHNLIDAGINPMEVTMVLLSHLHKDHAGGATRRDSILQQYHLSFPTATYYVQENELAFAFEKGFPSYITDELELLKHSDRMVLLNGNGAINQNIRYEISGAHCPYHQVFWIKEDGQTVFFGGDEAPQLHQMKSRFVAKYDYDGKKAMELRQKWRVEGELENWTFLFYHDIKTPLFTFSLE